MLAWFTHEGQERWKLLASSLLSGLIFFIIFELFYKRLKEFEKVTQFDKANFIKVINVKSPEPHIYIMETWTNMLLDQVYSEDFSSAIITTIKKGNKVGILLLNPENQELK